MTIDYDKTIGTFEGDNFIQKSYYKFRPKDEIWWLNRITWRVQSATIVKYCWPESDGGRWEIKPANNRPIIVPEYELFFNQEEAYKEGLIRLTRAIESLQERLNKALINRADFINEVKNEGLFTTTLH
jgi:hypothetical protein